ncbi:hypothetical protein RFI_08234 [Reticulomyxa filosa]|uniref:Tetratricopeptide repeat protein n=1 Tax=Reticulomyxa filosa TaxID=46433 RepID=X6NT32_RETFI|nr:hypothetical protein RFI_08234 [Reticulomyxa filosa]|eukprot:ETO28889.1 hypothetical protein RFI_08234 [Reticulomyxa filosa]
MNEFLEDARLLCENPESFSKKSPKYTGSCDREVIYLYQKILTAQEALKRDEVPKSLMDATDYLFLADTYRRLEQYDSAHKYLNICDTMMNEGHYYWHYLFYVKGIVINFTTSKEEGRGRKKELLKMTTKKKRCVYIYNVLFIKNINKKNML